MASSILNFSQKIKPFDPKLHKANDRKGRDLAKKVFTWIALKNKESGNRLWNKIEDHPNFKDIDLILKLDDEVIGYVDPEVRFNWMRGDFPFDTIHIPARKIKFLKKYPPSRVWFMSIRFDMGKVAIVCGREALKHAIVKQDTRLMDDDHFIDVPKMNAKIIDVKEVDSFLREFKIC